MSKEHLDIKGKEIKIGDVVVIHQAKDQFCEPDDFTEFFYGNIGVVTSFGCIEVQTLNTLICNKKAKYYECYYGAKITKIYFGNNEVEVIGKL